jgi:hypothetical protein
MSFTVVWKPRQKRHLAELWMAAADRAAVTTAADEIDRRLRAAPLEQGESREGRFRMLFVEPRGVKYRVFEQDRVVAVVRVWRSNSSGDR